MYPDIGISMVLIYLVISLYNLIYLVMGYPGNISATVSFVVGSNFEENPSVQSDEGIQPISFG